MTRFGAFTRFGQARFSSQPTHGERIYHDMVKNLGDGENYSDDFNSLAMARVFSNAMLFGQMLYTVERAGRQFRPSRAVDLLPALESEYGVDPDPTDTVYDRQRTLSAYARVPRGAKRENVLSVLSELLGADFLAYATTPKGDAVISPSDEVTVGGVPVVAGGDPVTVFNPAQVGIYHAPGTPRSVFRFTGPISFVGNPVTVSYEYIAGVSTVPKSGEKIAVDSGNCGRVEVVTLLAATPTTLTAVFGKPHDVGTVAATGRYPLQVTSKRHNLFVLSASAVRSQRKVRKANRLIRRLLRGVSTWAITEKTAPSAAGPFRVASGKIGITTIGSVILP